MLKILNFSIFLMFIFSLPVFSEKKYSYGGYFIDQKRNLFVVRMYEKNDKMKFYLYKKIRLEEVSSFFIKKNKLKDLYKEIWKEQKIFRKKYEHFKDINDKCNLFTKIKNDFFILAIEDDHVYGLDWFYFFDGKKLKKIDSGKVHPFTNDSFMYYDKNTSNIYFSGYKKEPNSRKYYDYGIYILNIKTNKVFLFDKNMRGKNNKKILSLCPYKISGTNKLIFIKNFGGYDEIVIKEMLN